MPESPIQAEPKSPPRTPLGNITRSAELNANVQPTSEEVVNTIPDGITRHLEALSTSGDQHILDYYTNYKLRFLFVNFKYVGRLETGKAEADNAADPKKNQQLKKLNNKYSGHPASILACLKKELKNGRPSKPRINHFGPLLELFNSLKKVISHYQELQNSGDGEEINNALKDLNSYVLNVQTTSAKYFLEGLALETKFFLTGDILNSFLKRCYHTFLPKDKSPTLEKLKLSINDFATRKIVDLSHLLGDGQSTADEITPQKAEAFSRVKRGMAPKILDFPAVLATEASEKDSPLGKNAEDMPESPSTNNKSLKTMSRTKNMTLNCTVPFLFAQQEDSNSRTEKNHCQPG